jgi:hypothetical protein
MVVRHQENFATPAFLIPPFACNPIENDRKASSLPSIWYPCSVLEPNLLLFSKNSIRFQISVRNFASCHLAMAIAVALFIEARHTNIRQRSEEDVYALGI